ncbi:MAG TPA: TlpA disulfide reductase family protein [Anaeromyxobacteraceae bacterium]|nr:TlpA disulfide reductase family protein [Anaeromyxobacteraceae bacterium]
MNRRVLVLVAAVAVLAVAIAGGVTAYDRWVVAPRQARLDEALAAAFGIDRSDTPAPPATVELSDGRPLVLTQLKGEVVFVNFWATWCPPCRDEMPSMVQLGQELSQRYPNKFRMVAVSVDESWQEVADFFGGRPPPGVLVVRDPEQIATRSYYCAARGGCPDSYKFPETYIVDREGRLVAYIVGPRDWSNPAAKQFLERLIEG